MNKFIIKIKNNPLFKDSFWALLGNVLGKGLSLIAGIAVARFLGNEAYGEYGMIRNNLLMIAVFSSLGLGYTATKFIAECKDEIQMYNIHSIVIRITLITSVIIAILVTFFSDNIARWLDAPNLGNLLRLSTIAIIFNAINTTQIGELSGLNAYKCIAKNNTWVGIITFFSSVLLTYYYDISGAVISLIISYASNCIFNYISISKYIKKPLLRNSKADYKKIISFTFPVALQESSYSITSWVSTVILIKLAGYGELGLYSAAVQWLAVMLFVPASLRNVALSHLTKNNNDINVNKKILKQMVQINLFATLIPFIVVAIISDWICSWYGSSYNGLQSVLNVCMFTAVINSLTNVISQNLIALNQNWYLFITRLLRDVLNLIVAALLIYGYGNGAIIYASSALVFQILYLIQIINKQNKLYNIQKANNYA